MRRGNSVLLLAIMFCLPATLYGQKSDFEGIRIFINPGHGGRDGDDRHMIATDFWESEGNLEKGLFLRDLLEARNATVGMSRTTNFTSDDLQLSVIATMANNFNADIFLSIHSNGFDGTRNQPLMLFRGYDDQPVFAGAKEFAVILWSKIFEKGNCWTNTFQWVKGDWTFYPEWGDRVGLGVLRTLAMPGVLSEGSFHDYVPEGWRLRNNSHLHHEAWAMLRALAEYSNVTEEPFGIIAGTVRDSLTSPDYYFKPDTPDEDIPLNGAVVTLYPGEKSVTLDNLNNGFFMFDSLSPGDYELVCSGMTDFYNDTLQAVVTAGMTTLADFLPVFDTARVPVITELLPTTTDSLLFNQSFNFTFNIPMDRQAVESAFVVEPAATLLFQWDDKGKVLTVRPETGFASKTSYLIRITTEASSLWDVPLLSEYQVSFVTKARSQLTAEMIWPSASLTGVTIYPRITIHFDAPLDHASASEGIRLLNSQSESLPKVGEFFAASEGKGVYSFEPATALQLNSQHKIVIDASVKDVMGVTPGTASETSFTTRSNAFQTGYVVESFNDISAFWDPEASGSTVGTDNPLTTFTASSDIYLTSPSSARLDYVFTGSNGGVCRVFDTRKPVVGSSTTLRFGMWVYGDLSFNSLEFWFYSPGTVNQIVDAGIIDWAGWELVTIPFSAIGGSGEWQYHSLVVRQTSTGAKSGTMFFDDGMVISPSAIDDNRYDDTEMILWPNPVSSAGTVAFLLGSPAYAELNVWSSDGRLVAHLFDGFCEPGMQTVNWNPAAAVAPGIYSIRLSLRGEGESQWRHTVRRWVVVR